MLLCALRAERIKRRHAPVFLAFFVLPLFPAVLGTLTGEDENVVRRHFGRLGNNPRPCPDILPSAKDAFQIAHSVIYDRHIFHSGKENIRRGKIARKKAAQLNPDRRFKFNLEEQIGTADYAVRRNVRNRPVGLRPVFETAVVFGMPAIDNAPYCV